MSKGTVYIAGPMRGIPLFNFPEFDRAAVTWQARGWTVVSPADMDREKGFDPAHDSTTGTDSNFLRDAIKRDVLAIIDKCSAIALLSGWEKSRGARVELALARFLGLRVFNAETGEEYGDQDPR